MKILKVKKRITREAIVEVINQISMNEINDTQRAMSTIRKLTTRKHNSAWQNTKLDLRRRLAKGIWSPLFQQIFPDKRQQWQQH